MGDEAKEALLVRCVLSFLVPNDKLGGIAVLGDDLGFTVFEISCVLLLRYHAQLCITTLQVRYTDDIIISWCICRRYHLRCILAISYIFFRFFYIAYFGIFCRNSLFRFIRRIWLHCFRPSRRPQTISSLPLKAEIVHVPNLPKGGAARRVATTKVGGTLKPATLLVLRQCSHCRL